MHEGDFSCVRAGSIALLEYLERPPETVIADLSIGDLALADFDQFSALIKDFAGLLDIKREKLRHADRYAVKNAFERTDRRICLVGFDQRNRRIRHSDTLGEFTLRYVRSKPHVAKPTADIDGNGVIDVRDIAAVSRLLPSGTHC